MKKLSWKVLSTKKISGNPFVPLYVDQCVSPIGTRIMYYHTGGSPSTVSVVAFTKQGKLILVRLYRHGAKRVFIEPVAGMLEKNETPRHGALRELLEETGFKPAKLIGLGEAYSDPSRSNAKSTAFVALGCVKVREQSLDKNEEIEVLFAEPGAYANTLKRNRFANKWSVSAILLANERFPKLFLGERKRTAV